MNYISSHLALIVELTAKSTLIVQMQGLTLIWQ